MRLDKYLSDSGKFTRSEAGRAIRAGRVAVNGISARDPSAKINENTATVTVDGSSLGYTKYRYIMLNKPSDYVSTTEDDPKSVMKLLPPECKKIGMFPCGRLDIDTLGLLIITNDGDTAHNLLSPKKHCEKTYRFRCSPPLDEKMKSSLEDGLELSDFTSKPCTVELTSADSGEITVTEGKYHQIKRMFHAVGSEITYLERVRFAGLCLDDGLGRGEWRELTADEVETILQYNKTR